MKLVAIVYETYMSKETAVMVESLILGSWIVLYFVILFFKDIDSLDGVREVQFGLDFDIVLQCHEVLELLVLNVLKIVSVHFVIGWPYY